MLSLVKSQLAAELNCTPADFDRAENVITTPVFSEQRRRFTNDAPTSFAVATFGGNAVIAADERLHAWLREFVRGKRAHELFEYADLREIERQLAPLGKQVYGAFCMYLPLGDAKPLRELPSGLALQWFEQTELHQFYGNKAFGNALCKEFMPQRPDMLAVGAVDADGSVRAVDADGSVIALAGCSADAPKLWQIGIDVAEAHRGCGVGTHLVRRLTDEGFRRGAVPYYGAAEANLHSRNVALNCGYRPTWMELASIAI